jgi:hypothetical protein
VSDIAQHLAVSGRVEIEDLDWEKARRIGLTKQEIESLQYFADIESQTVHYFLEVAKLKVSRDPELLTFLTMWNYEEYFHSYAILSRSSPRPSARRRSAPAPASRRRSRTPCR